MKIWSRRTSRRSINSQGEIIFFNMCVACQYKVQYSSPLLWKDEEKRKILCAYQRKRNRTTLRKRERGRERKKKPNAVGRVGSLDILYWGRCQKFEDISSVIYRCCWSSSRQTLIRSFDNNDDDNRCIKQWGTRTARLDKFSWCTFTWQEQIKALHYWSGSVCLSRPIRLLTHDLI